MNKLFKIRLILKVLSFILKLIYVLTPKSSFQQNNRRIRRIWKGVNRKNRLFGVDSFMSFIIAE